MIEGHYTITLSSSRLPPSSRMPSNTYEMSPSSSSKDKRSESPDSGVENSAYIGSKDTVNSTTLMIDVNPGGSDSSIIKGNGSNDIPALYEDVISKDGNCCTNSVKRITGSLSAWVSLNKSFLMLGLKVLLVLLWSVYFCYAMYYNYRDGWDTKNEPALRLIGINAFAIFCVIYWAVKKYYGRKIWKAALKPVYLLVSDIMEKRWNILKWLIAIVVVGSVTTVLVFDVGLKEPTNLVSLLGMAVYIGLFYIFSKHPQHVNWRPVIWGILLQFIFAYIILRTCTGFLVFKWLGDRVQEFLDHTNAGAKFVFGDQYEMHFFAFKVLPVVVFFSTAIAMLYYLGVMQIIIFKVSWIMQVCLGTTAGESLNAAANIFVGQTEAPLMIKPLIYDMTKSELHAVMTGGFATIAGSVLATYILFGVPANHLLSASVMSAPAALAMSKLFYPETKKSRTTTKDVQNMAAAPERNLIEAASSGASTSVKLVANIAANLIAFLALLQFINETLKWFGARVGIGPPDYPELTFQYICSYLLWPFAWVMGTPVDDCKQVATLIGVKTFTNEFIAYKDLSVLIANRELIHAFNQTSLNGTTIFNSAGNCYVLQNSSYTSLCLQQISERAEVIAIYALCGFANLGSIGIMLGGLGAMAPERKREMAEIVLRAMIAGNVACFMTACIAGVVTIPDEMKSGQCT